MESSSSSGNAKQRSLAKENSNLNVDECLDENKSKNTNKHPMESDDMSKDNPRGLISLVHYILMTGFGCRARDECRAITNGDLVFGPESSIEGLPQYLSLSERISKFC